MTTLIVILIIIAFFMFVWPRLVPHLRAWAMRRAQRKMENYIRQAMGMPPEDDKNKKHTTKRQTASRTDSRSHYGDRHYVRDADEPIIPREYAEDVEFEEIKNQSEETRIHSEDGEVAYTTEEQVSDAEYTIIRDK